MRGVLILMAAVLMLCGCTTHKKTNTVADSTVFVADESHLSAVANRRDSASRESWLMFDTLDILLPRTSDTLTPPVRIRAVNGVLTSASRRGSLSAVSVDITDSIRMLADTRNRTTAECAATAVYDPPEGNDILISLSIVAIAVFVVLVFCKRD